MLSGCFGFVVNQTIRSSKAAPGTFNCNNFLSNDHKLLQTGRGIDFAIWELIRDQPSKHGF